MFEVIYRNLLVGRGGSSRGRTATATGGSLLRKIWEV
jgi:hypothetical protein